MREGFPLGKISKHIWEKKNLGIGQKKGLSRFSAESITELYNSLNGTTYIYIPVEFFPFSAL